MQRMTVVKIETAKGYGSGFFPGLFAEQPLSVFKDAKSLSHMLQK
jgi:hypothetical protein